MNVNSHIQVNKVLKRTNENDFDWVMKRFQTIRCRERWS